MKPEFFFGRSPNPNFSDLFAYAFNSDLKHPHLTLLRERTGMILGDVRNPLKDHPGSARFATYGHLGLERYEHDGFNWMIESMTHQADLIDRAEVQKMRRVIEEILPQISPSWARVFLHSELG